MPNASEPAAVAPPSTGASTGRRRRTGPGATSGVAVVVVVGLLALYPVAVGNAYFRYVGVLTVMYMALATSWNLMGGFTGYMSLGHSAFFGFGAYAAGLLVTRLDWPNIPAVLAGGVLLAAFGAAVGFVALRVRGASFVIVTIALVYISNLVVQGWRGLTGGSMGLTVPSGFDLSRAAQHQVFHWLFCILLLAVLGLWWFVDRSKFGMGLKAIREDEDKAQSLGVDTTGFKLTAFSLSAAFTGMGGGLYASWFGFLDPIFSFSILIGANLVLMSLLGGIRTLWGPLLGAAIVVPSTEWFIVRFGASQLHLVATGLLLAVVVLTMPDGIIPSVTRLLSRRRAPAASIREQQAGPAGRETTGAAR